jgi:uncharacterized membrane protein YfhO
MLKKGRRFGSLEAWAAFALPVTVMLAVYWRTRLYPLGGHTLLVYDMRQQYTSFYAWLKDAAASGEGIWFSLSKGLGGETAGFVAYYLMSPLNVLFLLLPKAVIPEIVALVTLLKLGLSGLTMRMLLRRARPNAPPWLRLAASLGYALMAYVVMYQQNLMWMDGIVLLPLVALGLLRIAEGKRPWCYLFSLTAAILTNYYIGAMICLFCVLFFAFLMLRERRQDLWWRVGRFALASLLAGGLAAWLLLPTVRSFAGGKAIFDAWRWSEKIGFTPMEFASRLVGGMIVLGDHQACPPAVYAGMLPLTGLGVVFAHRRVTVR